MRPAQNERVRLDRLEEGEWLNQLLADIRQELKTQPTANTVGRIRTRLLHEMSTPAKAAA